MRLKLALRNVWRNRVRSLLSILMIAGASVAILLISGFSDFLRVAIRDGVIENQYGHVQVATQAYWDGIDGSRRAQLVPDYRRMLASLESVPGVRAVSGRLSFDGLLSVGEKTISARGIGFDPAREAQLTRNATMVAGRRLTGSDGAEVLVGTGLQKQLGVQVGQTITALSYTLDGVVNAVDLTVVGVFTMGLTELDNHVFMLPLSRAQTLLDTDTVETLTVRAVDIDAAAGLREEVQRRIAALGPAYRARTWYELSKDYRQVESYIRFQNRMVDAVLIALILLGIMNAVGLSVYERTGEIGTLLALGESEGAIVSLFTLEGALLGLIGTAVGFVAGTGLACLITALELKIDLPGASALVPVVVAHPPAAYLDAACVCLLAGVAATWLPAVRASRIPIVDALRKNI